MLLSKVIAGLDLPARPIPVPHTWFGAQTPRALAHDAIVHDTLDDGDMRLTNGAFADDYEIALDAAQTIVLATKGGPSKTETCCAVDVLTQIFLGDTLVASDDDGGGSFDSRLAFTANVKGTYRVRVTTSGAGYKTGAYTLSVSRPS